MKWTKNQHRSSVIYFYSVSVLLMYRCIKHILFLWPVPSKNEVLGGDWSLWLSNLWTKSYDVFLLTLSLPECLIDFCEVTLTFEFVDVFLWCDHSNESSLPELWHCWCYYFVCQNFRKWNLEIWSKSKVKWNLFGWFFCMVQFSLDFLYELSLATVRSKWITVMTVWSGDGGRWGGGGLLLLRLTNKTLQAKNTC